MTTALAKKSLEFIRVCFDGSGRNQGQAAAPTRLRAAGLATSLRAASIGPDVVVSEPDPARGPLAGLINERALLEMVQEVYLRVRASLLADRFPVLYGADCSVLLGAVPAVRDAADTAGLLFVDAHEDATTMEQSTTGEAANMEIALLLGTSGAHAPPPLRDRLPALRPEAIVMLGQRDMNYRRQINVPSIAGRVEVHPAQELRGTPETIATKASSRLALAASGWWLHVDLDVLDRSQFRACGAASDPSMPEGLTWTQLSEITRSALRADGCRGWSIAVYNPDLDPDNQDAEQILAYLANVTRDYAANESSRC